MARYQSWGRFPKAEHEIVQLHWRDLALPANVAKTMLPFGNGRSYGDSCLNDQNILLDARGLDRFIQFDSQTGVLRCEAGVLLSEVLAVVVPHGWFLPVTPGTQFVTIGGAVANDVHGKNHHRVGTFGRHVRGFELLRSDGTRRCCSPTENQEWFRATIGGLGLTGLMTWIEIQLTAIAGPEINQETIRFARLDEFFSLARESDSAFEHTVAWVDCAARGTAAGRGVFMRGNYRRLGGSRSAPAHAVRCTVPFDPPSAILNRVSLRIFNAMYYHHHLRKRTKSVVHYEKFFYPLDSVGGWNKLYGSRGLLQYQCVVPHADADPAIREMLDYIARAGTGSFLAVLKVFGDLRSPGLLSFPRPGVTLALDFPNLGKRTLDLLHRLETITSAAGGAVYPAKDARMSANMFRQSFPQWTELEPYIDSRFSSSFWRRVGQEKRS